MSAPVDMTKPIELISDGTPLDLDRPQPDEDGDYWVAREDGKQFTKEQSGYQDGIKYVCVGADGTRRGKPFVRNRAAPPPQPDLSADDIATIARVLREAGEAELADRLDPPAPTDPLLIEARKIYADRVCAYPTHRGQILAGEYDHRSYLRDIHEGLRRGVEIERERGA